MLLELCIVNIVLIEEAQLQFTTGVTILSGETGAGKSAILKALGLLLGERADPKLLRSGSTRGSVEGSFATAQLPALNQLLVDAGIAHDPSEPLIVRRELFEGRSRAFVNQCAVQRSFLQVLGTHLIDLVGQHANQRLADMDYHRVVLDLYAHIDRQPFAECWHMLERLRTQRALLAASEAERVRALATCQRELNELELLDSGIDEESLAHDHTRLRHAEALRAATESAAASLDQLLPELHQIQQSLTRQLERDGTLEPLAKGIDGALLELNDALSGLLSYSSSLDVDPEQLSVVEAQIEALERLKRTFGPTLADARGYRQQRQRELNELQLADGQMTELEKKIAELERECDRLANRLTEERGRAAKAMAAALLRHLRPLNMQAAQFEVRLSSAPRSEWGDERAEFFFAPNRGEGVLPVRSCGSGGELARLLLALKTTLAGLEQTPTLIFDEIDANVGGETATLVGRHLHRIARGRQVLVVTHLPQVAQQGDAHFCIAKREVNGRTVSEVHLLKGQARQEELQRMRGGVLCESC